jgi:hypothetical protein
LSHAKDDEIGTLYHASDAKLAIKVLIRTPDVKKAVIHRFVSDSADHGPDRV